MHFVTFAFKRAHYTTLAMTRPLAEKFGLTPARFDLLRCIRLLRDQAFQANIARSLGVSQVTIHRMIRAMQAKGLVRRERAQKDTRKWRIRITACGRRRYYLLLRRLQRKLLQRKFQSFAAQQLGYQYEEALLWMSGHVSWLRSAMRELGDRATFDYPDWDFVDT